MVKRPAEKWGQKKEKGGGKAGRKMGAEKRKGRGKGWEKKDAIGRRFSFCSRFSAGL